MYRRVDGDGFLARFGVAGEKELYMIATGATEEEVREKVRVHYERAEESIRRQDAGLEARREANRLARERKQRKEAADEQ